MPIHEPLRLLRIPHRPSNSCFSQETASSYLCQAKENKYAHERTDEIFYNGYVTTAEGNSLEVMMEDEDLNEQYRDIMAPWIYTARNIDVSVISGLLTVLRGWYGVLNSDAKIISRCGELIHISSLMLDDTETAAPSRRGRPAAHTVFGVTQTVHSAKVMTIKGIKELAKLRNAECMRILLGEIVRKSFNGGQQHAVANTSVDDHIEDLNMRFGSIIRLVNKLMIAASAHRTHETLDCDHLINLFARLYAVRDDYVNLAPVATSSKHPWASTSSLDSKIQSFYMALDEGKYSLLLVHALNVLPGDKSVILEGILTQRRNTVLFKAEHKAVVLEILRGCGSFEFVVGLIRDLQGEIVHALDELEVESENFCLDESPVWSDNADINHGGQVNGVSVDDNMWQVAGKEGGDIDIHGFKLLVERLGI